MLKDILETQYKKLYERFAQADEEECKIVLLGDSMINYWPTEKFYDNDNIINRGIPGDTTKGILNRLHQLIDLKPSVVILSTGSNDLQLIDDGIDNIVKRILKIKYLLQEAIPNLEIYILSLTPILLEHEITNYEYMVNRTNDIIDEINSELALFTNIIDVNIYLKDLDGNLKLSYTRDGIHLTNEGYQVFSKVIAKNISQLKLKRRFTDE